MNGTVYYQRLDEDLFPELQFGPGRKGIHACLLARDGDPRVQTSAGAKGLLVVFRLDEPESRLQADLAPVGWQIEVERRDAQGRPVRHRIAVLPALRDGNVTQELPAHPGPPGSGRAIYRGAWWADLAALDLDQPHGGGLKLTIQFSIQAPSQVVLG